MAIISNVFPENLVIKLCSFFSGEKLSSSDLLQASYASATLDEKAQSILENKDKEFFIKSRILQVTQEGVYTGRCCPMHSNEGIRPVMQTVRSQFPKIGKGNIGFGSAFYAEELDIAQDDGLAAALKSIGCYGVLANTFVSGTFAQTLFDNYILPLRITSEDAGKLNADDYILLKNLRNSLEEGIALEGYVIRIGEGLEALSLSKM